MVVEKICRRHKRFSLMCKSYDIIIPFVSWTRDIYNIIIILLLFMSLLGHTCTCAMHSICVYKKQEILNYTWTSGTVHALHFIGVKRKNAKGIAGSLRVKILIFYYFHFREQPHI